LHLSVFKTRLLHRLITNHEDDDAVQVACDLELWQEAFRSVEDIQGLLSQSKKAPKPQMMATYYAKLTKIFTVSDSYLYNGYAW